ncbi:Uncharacterised protein [Candidatus Burarchaeum australiense]|nr:Uncharacterised protein [Candidatus Burarchaeum australiense]
MYEFEAARTGIAVLGTALATYYDLTHNRNVPDWLTFGMLGIGSLAVLAGLAATGFAGWQEIAVSAVLPALIVLSGGYLLYRAGQLGGADVLVFAAIALLMPQAPAGLWPAANYAVPVPLPFVFSLFLASGILFGIWTFLRFLAPCIRALMKGKVKLENEQKLAIGLFALIDIILAWFTLSSQTPLPFMNIWLVLLLVASVFAVFFYVFKSFIAEEFLIRRVSVKEMDEEDVLAIEEMNPVLVKKYGLQKLLTRKEIEKLRKLPLKKFPVYKNMPAFMPYVLAALVLSLLLGDPMALVLYSV